jgi:spore germination protein GerM
LKRRRKTKLMKNIRLLVAGAVVLVLIMAMAVWRDRDLSPSQADEPVAEEGRVEIYFAHNRLGDYSKDCDDVFVVHRPVAAGEDLPAAALRELLEGTTLAEQTEGYVTNIASGVELQNLEIADGVATATFSEDFLKNVAGACRIESIRSQVDKTLLQFPEIQSVVIKVDGVPDSEVLQP